MSRRSSKSSSERILTDIDTLRKQAKNARNPEVLQELVDNHGYDEIICWNLANNSASNTYTREKLAKHVNPKIRYVIAQHSEELKSQKVLVSLCFDIPEIKEQVARTTTSESIKELLFKGNPSNRAIRKLCLKRMHNMEVLEKFILNASQDDLFLYAQSIIENTNLTKQLLLLLILISEKLSDEHIRLIHKHIQYDEKWFKTLLARLEQVAVNPTEAH